MDATNPNKNGCFAIVEDFNWPKNPSKFAISQRKGGFVAYFNWKFWLLVVLGL